MLFVFWDLGVNSPAAVAAGPPSPHSVDIAARPPPPPSPRQCLGVHVMQRCRAAPEEPVRAPAALPKKGMTAGRYCCRRWQCRRSHGTTRRSDHRLRQSFSPVTVCSLWF